MLVSYLLSKNTRAAFMCTESDPSRLIKCAEKHKKHNSRRYTHIIRTNERTNFSLVLQFGATSAIRIVACKLAACRNHFSSARRCFYWREVFVWSLQVALGIIFLLSQDTYTRLLNNIFNKAIFLAFSPLQRSRYLQPRREMLDLFSIL
jgi:hypothetical protein